MDKSDWQRILHIRAHCEDVEQFIERFGHDYATFADDRAYFNAVSMSIFQIGELANGLSEDFRQKTSAEMPWGVIRGMRNIFAHAYSDIDVETVWYTANNDIPQLKEFCNKILYRDKQKTNRDSR